MMAACLSGHAQLDAAGRCIVCERLVSPPEELDRGVIEVRNEADKDALNAKLSGFHVVFSEPKDTIGSAIDALNAGIAMVNAASERMKAFGLSPQISVNGTDYGDKVSVYVQGDLVR